MKKNKPQVYFDGMSEAIEEAYRATRAKGYEPVEVAFMWNHVPYGETRDTHIELTKTVRSKRNASTSNCTAWSLASTNSTTTSIKPRKLQLPLLYEKIRIFVLAQQVIRHNWCQGINRQGNWHTNHKTRSRKKDRCKCTQTDIRQVTQELSLIFVLTNKRTMVYTGKKTQTEMLDMLVENRHFCKDAAISDLTPAERKKYMTENFNDEEIQAQYEFHCVD